jgi:hypothetical protein
MLLCFNFCCLCIFACLCLIHDNFIIALVSESLVRQQDVVMTGSDSDFYE